MSGIRINGNNHSSVFYGADAIKEIYRGSTLLWRKPTSNVLSLIHGSWAAYGLSVAVDESGIITLNGAVSVNSVFIRLTNRFAANTSSIGIADADNVFVPAGADIHFGVEYVSGSFSRLQNALNIVLRDTSNVARFNCMLGDGVFSQEGTAAADISCLAIYIRNTVQCSELRIRPFIEIR